MNKCQRMHAFVSAPFLEAWTLSVRSNQLWAHCPEGLWYPETTSPDLRLRGNERDANVAIAVINPQQRKIRVTEDLLKERSLLPGTRTLYERDFDLLHLK